MAATNPAQTLLSSTYRERDKLNNEGSNADVGSILTGMRKHRLDRDGDGVGLRCNPLLKNGNKRVVIKADSIKSEWLGLWKGPLRNPFNMYGTLPSRMKSRDKRKTYSVPPLIDISTDLKVSTIMPRPVGTSNAAETSADHGVGNICVDLVGACARMPVMSEVQRINTILSEPKSDRSSITVSTGRSTVDSFRYSESFNELVAGGSGSSSSSVRAKTLLNNLYVMTRNGFLSGALPEHPWKSKHQVDADFIAVSLARKGDSNPGLLLFHDLEAIVSAPPRYRNSGEAYVRSAWQSYDSSLGTWEMRLGGFGVRNKVHKNINSTADALKVDAQEFKVSSEEEMLIWNASTDLARATMRRSGIVQRPVKFDMNDDFMVTDADDYAVLQTRFGRIIYSPKFKDEQYMYRFVVLTKEAQEAVDALSRTLPNSGRLQGTYAPSSGPRRYLSEFEIVRQLGIQMSPGWEHFMYFKNSHKELVLRKRL
ncbi:uncharacterized protein BXIN_2052 [Babesia sp. Xinjiang]|uniref:uncharacterized protein n=1 Tax=Babesia sp. Xinjiang TaxID=462227 RepID=UPI000A223CA2|nr:uncharacterized protein BXIN_2052 [Babesia sp. Xinjiang]ORM40565.1 hypothetical protein BXIN_2052 [Babesia sp. Xinjiang]